jgi:hypothetical protein
VLAKRSTDVVSGDFEFRAEHVSGDCVAPRRGGPNLDALARGVCAVEEAADIRGRECQGSFSGQPEKAFAHRLGTALRKEDLRNLRVGKVSRNREDAYQLSVAIRQPGLRWYALGSRLTSFGLLSDHCCGTALAGSSRLLVAESVISIHATNTDCNG